MAEWTEVNTSPADCYVNREDKAGTARAVSLLKDNYVFKARIYLSLKTRVV